MADLVSIITPSYNSARFIGATLDSVVAQSWPDWEMIVVDDGSTDDTVAMVQARAEAEPRLKLLRMARNGGPAASRNLGIEHARGRYIAFLDSDDLWAPDKLARQIPFMADRGAPLSYTAYRKIDEDGTPCGGPIAVPLSIDYRALLNSSMIGCLTAVYDTRILGKVAMPLIAKRQDYGLWLQILRAGHVAHGLPEPLACLRKRQGSVSSNKLSATWYTWKVYRDLERLPLPRALYHLTRQSWNAWKRARV